jgi:tetratricopeptide (TPR) repeat protein
VKNYVPRPLPRDQIRTQLWNDPSNSNMKRLVVHGLGGAGKTQLVLDYVRQYHLDYKAIFWIEAGRKESLERDFIHLYRALWGVQTVSGVEKVSVESAVIGVKSWFSGQPGSWLMVFDGADVIENEDSIDYIDIKHFIPDVASLHVIITSRSTTAKDMTQLDGVLVGEMEEAQAMELFYQYSQARRDDEGVEYEVKAIVQELGRLALAITLAATYVGRTPRLRSDIKEYLPEYQRRRHELLQRKPENLIHQYSQSVLTTWETSYQAIHEQDPMASTLMTILSFLNFDDIFLELFDVSHRPEGRELISKLTKSSSPSSGNMHNLEEYFELLQRYSFVTWKEDQQSYTMHKLVHTWGYERLAKKAQLGFSGATLQLIRGAINDTQSTPKTKIRLVSHVMANFTRLAGCDWASFSGGKSMLHQMSRVGEFLTDIGRFGEAYIVEKYVLDESRRILGEEHYDTIHMMNNLANALSLLGKLDDVAAMRHEVLSKMQRTLGEDHLSTIGAMFNLAGTLDNQGKLEEAATMKQEVISRRRRALGKDHPDTIEAISSLANTLFAQKKSKKAAALLHKVLSNQQRTLGKEHSSTLDAMNNLAVMLAAQGKQLEAAAELIQEVLSTGRRVLGEEHPITISAWNNLASILATQGKPEEAVPIMQEVLSKRQRILGKEHPDTISTMHNFACILIVSGRPQEAADLRQEVLLKQRRILGDDHLDTISAMNYLAETLYTLGNLDAVAMMQEVYSKRRRILGMEHPETLRTVNNLASMLLDQGKQAEAGFLLSLVVVFMAKTSSEGHPWLLDAERNLERIFSSHSSVDESSTE